MASTQLALTPVDIPPILASVPLDNLSTHFNLKSDFKKNLSFLKLVFSSFFFQKNS